LNLVCCLFELVLLAWLPFSFPVARGFRSVFVSSLAPFGSCRTPVGRVALCALSGCSCNSNRMMLAVVAARHQVMLCMAS
jgi:hypothetical protein